MKVGYSMPDSLALWVETTARRISDGNASIVAAAAIAQLAKLPDSEIQRLIIRQRAERNTGTRDAWMRAFWQWLGDLFGTKDPFDNPYGPRTYGKFMIVFLLKGYGEVPEESDEFYIHTTAAHDAPTQERNTWMLPRSASPVEAAETVAAWIHQQGGGGAAL